MRFHIRRRNHVLQIPWQKALGPLIASLRLLTGSQRMEKSTRQTRPLLHAPGECFSISVSLT